MDGGCGEAHCRIALRRCRAAARTRPSRCQRPRVLRESRSGASVRTCRRGRRCRPSRPSCCERARAPMAAATRTLLRTRTRRFLAYADSAYCARRRIPKAYSNWDCEVLQLPKSSRCEILQEYCEVLQRRTLSVYSTLNAIPIIGLPRLLLLLQRERGTARC